MIKNNTQLSHTKDNLKEFLKAKKEFESENSKDSFKYKIGISSLNSMIDDLNHQIKDYENLQNERVQIKSKKLQELSDLLICGRLAKGWTQVQLAKKLNIDVQQIQRYESTNYESASFMRLVDVAVVLGLNLHFKDVIVFKEAKQKEIVANLNEFEIYKNKICKEHSLLTI